MKTKTLVLSVSFVVSFTTSFSSLAASVLIEKANGKMFAEVLPRDACELRFEDSVIGQDVVKTFPMDDGTVAVNQNLDGFLAGYSWSITTKEGPQITRTKGWTPRAQFFYRAPGSEWVRSGNVDRDAISAVPTRRVYEGTEKQCTAFLNTESNQFFGHRLSRVTKLTFFTSDTGAATVIESAIEAEERRRKLDLVRVEAWRKKITLGTSTHCGMVVDAKAPLTKVQTAVGEKWFKTSQLHPAGEKQCIFVQGQYQD